MIAGFLFIITALYMIFFFSRTKHSATSKNTPTVVGQEQRRAGFSPTDHPDAVSFHSAEALHSGSDPMSPLSLPSYEQELTIGGTTLTPDATQSRVTDFPMYKINGKKMPRAIFLEGEKILQITNKISKQVSTSAWTKYTMLSPHQSTPFTSKPIRALHGTDTARLLQILASNPQAGGYNNRHGIGFYTALLAEPTASSEKTYPFAYNVAMFYAKLTVDYFKKREPGTSLSQAIIEFEYDGPKVPHADSNNVNDVCHLSQNKKCESKGSDYLIFKTPKPGMVPSAVAAGTLRMVGFYVKQRDIKLPDAKATASLNI